MGRLHHLVVDTPDPSGLAAFWSQVLGLPVTYASDAFVVVSADDRTSGLAFQLAPDHAPPVRGDSGRPQQMHHDVMVDDVATAEGAVAALGATRLSPLGDEASDGSDGSVWADPSGHPFCLIPRPSWASPVAPSSDGTRTASS